MLKTGGVLSQQGIGAGAGQFAVVPLHTAGEWQLSPVAQTVPPGKKASGGQAAEEPVQDSGTSQTPAFGRQVVPAGTKGFGGQAAEEPVQVAGMSQAPVFWPQVVPAGTKGFGGQAAEEPVQAAGTSQAPVFWPQT